MALPTPNNDQRQLVSEYIWNDDLNGGRGAFLSPELRGDNPEVYREEWLDDLVVFEHVAESMDAFARWITQPLLEAAHFCCLGRGKVRLPYFHVSICGLRRCYTLRKHSKRISNLAFHTARKAYIPSPVQGPPCHSTSTARRATPCSTELSTPS